MGGAVMGGKKNTTQAASGGGSKIVSKFHKLGGLDAARRCTEGIIRNLRYAISNILIWGCNEKL